MSVEREEGCTATIGFDKLEAVAAAGQRVVPVVLQHADTGDVLFVAYANRAAVEATIDEGIAVLWSTSRDELWRKGSTSGDVLRVTDIRINCEQNSLLYRVLPAHTGVCHTRDESGATRPTCYYRRLLSIDDLAFVDLS